MDARPRAPVRSEKPAYPFLTPPLPSGFPLAESPSHTKFLALPPAPPAAAPTRLPSAGPPALPRRGASRRGPMAPRRAGHLGGSDSPTSGRVAAQFRLTEEGRRWLRRRQIWWRLPAPPDRTARPTGRHTTNGPSGGGGQDGLRGPLVRPAHRPRPPHLPTSASATARTQPAPWARPRLGPAQSAAPRKPGDARPEDGAHGGRHLAGGGGRCRLPGVDGGAPRTARRRSRVHPRPE